MIKFWLGERSFNGDIADNCLKRAVGLMFRESIPHDYGMVFPIRGIARFWMLNVRFPLELLCIRNDKVSEIIPMEVCCKSKGRVFYTSHAPVDYAVEVNAGFSARKGIAVGTEFNLYL